MSAEHGVGQLKRDELAATAPAVGLDLMRRIQAAFDPAGIMNPGKVILSGQRRERSRFYCGSFTSPAAPGSVRSAGRAMASDREPGRDRETAGAAWSAWRNSLRHNAGSCARFLYAHNGTAMHGLHGRPPRRKGGAARERALPFRAIPAQMMMKSW